MQTVGAQWLLVHEPNASTLVALVQTASTVPVVLLAAGGATIRLWPLIDTHAVDRSRVVFWPDPQLVLEPDPNGGPVVVTTVYTIAPANEQPFVQAMAKVRLSRLRTGATQWELFRDGETAHRFVEIFVVPSWDEHLRQHRERLTGADEQYEAAAEVFSVPPSQTTHLISVDAPRSP
ncbi:MAG: MFS transporter [Acetobacteraceae bacterium]|nr:MFS transporter [Acetobacteraceae bacterium]